METGPTETVRCTSRKFNFDRSPRKLRHAIKLVMLTVLSHVRTDKAEDEEEAIQMAKEVVDLIRRRHDETSGPTKTWRVYPNGSMLPGTTGEEIFQEKYPRLQKLKAKYDPNNVLHRKHPINPA